MADNGHCNVYTLRLVALQVTVSRALWCDVHRAGSGPPDV